MKTARFADGEFHLGDCLNVMATLPDASVDMVLCDLPYGTTQCAWDSVIPFDALWRAWRRVTTPGAAVVLTASQPFTSLCVASDISEFKHAWVWNKAKAANFPQVKRHPLKIHEDVLVFGGPYYPQMTQGALRNKGGYPTKDREVSVNEGAPLARNDQYYPKSILDFSTAGNKEIEHPTQKPVALFEYLIKTYTNPGAVVLDNCAGSGTTAIAARRTGRKWVCIERDETYFANALCRVLDEPAPA